MPHTYLQAVREPGQTVNHLFTHLDIRLAHAEQGQATLAMPLGEHLRQGGGKVAGGILATMADEAMAHAVLSSLPQGKAAVTAEMNIRYLRGADPGKKGEITATASIIKHGQSLIVTEASVLDERGRLLATAGATFYVVSV